jgi:DNA-directed RNA polymerase specialized sigma24 family protein
MNSDALPVPAPDVMAGGFHTTRWTQVMQARECSGAGLDALRDLCAAYYAPVIAFLIRQGNDADAARDLAHEFFARMLEGDAICGADRAQGRFRSYLLGAVKHFVAHVREYGQRQRRGGGVPLLSIDESLPDSPALKVPDDARLSPDAAFDRQWALTVLSRAMEALEKECAAQGKSTVLDHLRPWLLGESVHGDQTQEAKSLGMSAGTMKVAVHRMRQRFRRLVKAEIACTLNDDAAVDEEMEVLLSALGG